MKQDLDIDQDVIKLLQVKNTYTLRPLLEPGNKNRRHQNTIVTFKIIKIRKCIPNFMIIEAIQNQQSISWI